MLLVHIVRRVDDLLLCWVVALFHLFFVCASALSYSVIFVFCDSLWFYVCVCVYTHYVHVVCFGCQSASASVYPLMLAGERVLEIVRAQFDYSATTPEQLSFTTGQVMAVLDHGEDGTWWKAVNLDERTKQGWVTKQIDAQHTTCISDTQAALTLIEANKRDASQQIIRCVDHV